MTHASGTDAACSHPLAREVGLSVATAQSTTGGTLILVGGGTSPDAYLEACLTTSRELADSGVLGPVPSAHDSEPHGMPAERDALRILGKALHAVIPRDHDRVIARISVVGGVTAGTIELHAANGSSTSLSSGRGVFRAARDLRRVMSKPEAGTWFTGVFTVTAGGKLSARYDYDHEPEPGSFAAEAYRADFDEFPRTPKNTPDWLAAILAGAPTRHDLVGRGGTHEPKGEPES